MANIARSYSTKELQGIMQEQGIKPMTLVRSGYISTTSAYRIARGESVHSVDVIYRACKGLLAQGVSVDWASIMSNL